MPSENSHITSAAWAKGGIVHASGIRLVQVVKQDGVDDLLDADPSDIVRVEVGEGDG
jgi:hypothetical protein